MQGKVVVVQQMFSACSLGGFFQFAVRKVKFRGRRMVQEFMAPLINFLLG